VISWRGGVTPVVSRGSLQHWWGSDTEGCFWAAAAAGGGYSSAREIEAKQGSMPANINFLSPGPPSSQTARQRSSACAAPCGVRAIFV